MGCNCGGKVTPKITNQTANLPTVSSGTNQMLLRQIATQQEQQAAIQRIINPPKTVIKTYR